MAARGDYFGDGRANFYYSRKYVPLMNCFRHMANEEQIEGAGLYQDVPHLMVMAAAIGLVKGVREKVDLGDKKSIDVFVSGWHNSKFHGQPLALWAALIVWIDKGSDKNAPIFNLENDVELCNTFNELAMGGLSYLKKKQYSSGVTDTSGYQVMTDELAQAIKKLS